MSTAAELKAAKRPNTQTSYSASLVKWQVLLRLRHWHIVRLQGCGCGSNAEPPFVSHRTPVVLQWWLTHTDGTDEGYCAGEEREQPFEVHLAQPPWVCSAFNTAHVNAL